ncbi:MAG: hypothetical protein NVS3B10_14150 [Polyangiales bacterium]
MGLLVACGGSGADSTPPDNSVGFAPSNPAASLDKASGQCATDGDCASGFACMTISLGELTQMSCVSTSADAGSPSTSDASVGPTTDGGPVIVPPGPANDGGTVIVPPAPDAGDAGVTGASDAGTACSTALVVTITTVAPHPRPKGDLDTTVDTSSPAVLGYVCGGGTASVTFGAQTFTGSDTSGGVVTVQNESTYSMSTPFLGGVTCKIDAYQTITGTLASGTLQYTYTEACAPGQSSICPLAFQLCSASGPVAVH